MTPRRRGTTAAREGIMAELAFTVMKKNNKNLSMTGLSHIPERSLNNKTGRQKYQMVNKGQEYHHFKHCWRA